MIFGTTRVRILNYRARLEACLSLYVDHLLPHLFKVIGCLVLLLHLNYNRGLEAFAKIPNHDGLIWSPVNIKFYHDKLEVLEI